MDANTQKALESLRRRKVNSSIAIAADQANDNLNSICRLGIKSDYMGNDQLLPAYNVQIGVADEFIAVIDVNQYRSDMDCLITMLR